MTLSLHTAFALSAASREFTSQEGWGRESVSSDWGIEPLVGRVTGAMQAAGYSSQDIFAVRLALEEAVVNAIKHGHQGDTSKAVRVAYQVTPECVQLEVEDQGPGFRPDELPDPLDPENLERACGRGVFLMRHYMHEVAYNERGNCVRLCRRRS
jgi:serine/threonine-protein kinase RsbW